MITVIKQGNAYNRRVISLEGLSTDTKPVEYFIETDSNGVEVAKVYIENGSTFTEIDTGKLFMYDAENTVWYKIETSGGGGGGTQGGIVLVGETTTALTDEATTNPITVDGQSYTAQPNDAVIYGSKEFLFDGTKWHEFGDLSGLASKDIGAMTGYAKASTGSAITTTDTLNQAIGKVEKRVEVNENNILSIDAIIGKQVYSAFLGRDSGTVQYQMKTNDFQTDTPDTQQCGIYIVYVISWSTTPVASIYTVGYSGGTTGYNAATKIVGTDNLISVDENRKITYTGNGKISIYAMR